MFEINTDQEDEDDSDAEEYADYKEHEPPMQQAPSTLYQMIWQAVHEDRESPVKFPEGCGRRVIYILGCPLTHSQWLTVKNPMKPKQENYYPVSLFMASLWILFYSFIIVWFTFEVTQAYKLHFSVLPMALYPFGIAMRDLKRLSDMEKALKKFKVEMKGQRVSLAETFSGPIF